MKILEGTLWKKITNTKKLVTINNVAHTFYSQNKEVLGLESKFNNYYQLIYRICIMSQLVPLIPFGESYYILEEDMEKVFSEAKRRINIKRVNKEKKVMKLAKTKVKIRKKEVKKVDILKERYGVSEEDVGKAVEILLPLIRKTKGAYGA